MSDLGFYLEGAEDGKAELLRQQWTDAFERREVRCICGLLRALELAFRCYYCGVYFCATCAEGHFGESRAAWRERNRGEPDGTKDSDIHRRV